MNQAHVWHKYRFWQKPLGSLGWEEVNGNTNVFLQKYDQLKWSFFEKIKFMIKNLQNKALDYIIIWLIL